MAGGPLNLGPGPGSPDADVEVRREDPTWVAPDLALGRVCAGEPAPLPHLFARVEPKALSRSRPAGLRK